MVTKNCQTFEVYLHLRSCWQEEQLYLCFVHFCEAGGVADGVFGQQSMVEHSSFGYQSRVVFGSCFDFGHSF